MSMSPHPSVDPVDEPAADASAPAAPSRRSFVRTVGLGAAALGAAATTGIVLTGGAGAQTAEAELPDLNPGDVDIVRFLQSVSLACEEVLTAAVDIPSVQGSESEELRTFGRHHGDQATALGALLPEEEQVTEPNPSLTTEQTARVTEAADSTALLGALLGLEEQVAATMLTALGEAESFVVAETISKALPVCGQMAASLGTDLDAPMGSWLPSFGSTDGALSPAQYPVS